MITTLHSPARSRRGIVLIIVMWIALGLISLALYFGNSVGMEYRAADNSLSGLQGEQAVEGGRRYLATMLGAFTNPGVMPSLDEQEYRAENVAVGMGRFYLVGRDPNAELDSTTVAYGLVDEAGKININTAPAEVLELLPGMTADLAGAIVDWRDEDEEVSAGGAEAADYLALEPGYAAKNAPFESPEELRLVYGMTPEILWGEDVNQNGVLDANEDDGDASWPNDDQDGRLDAGLLEYVTTFTREPNTRADGQPRVNLRADNARTELRRLLEETFDAGRAESIMTLVNNRLADMESPLALYYEGQLTPQEFTQIEPALSVTAGDYIVGRTNISTAPLPVLACLPSMDESKAEQLIAARKGKDRDALKSVIWITEVLDQATVEQIAPYITAQSYQFSADLVGQGHDGQGFRRQWMVFDMGETVKLIYRRDRARSGWPLGDLSAAEDTAPSGASARKL